MIDLSQQTVSLMKPVFTSAVGPTRATYATYAAYALASVMLAGCGGGGGSGGDSASTPAPTVSSQTVGTVQSAKLCGVDVGPKRLEGLVSAVHDGDTITLGNGAAAYKIRLDGIDAPELAQPFGNASQSALAAAVLGQSVTVTYTKTDQYDRIVGAVFTDSCQYVNLTQVSTGLAWFYKAYQCEISAALRLQFSQEQDRAAGADRGLWAQADPEAPWFYRNGSEPVTPVCSSEAALPAANAALTTPGMTTPANSSAPVTVVGANGGTSTVICYTGPRGGTYTLNASGTKNYGGC
jgi:endonuclease YncB( thermonuclease family)